MNPDLHCIGYFRENLENDMNGKFVKIRKFDLVIIFAIFAKK